MARQKPGIQLLRKDYPTGAHALIVWLTKIIIPPVVKVLYEDWKPQCRSDSRFTDSGVLDNAITNTVAHASVWPITKLGRDQ